MFLRLRNLSVEDSYTRKGISQVVNDQWLVVVVYLRDAIQMDLLIVLESLLQLSHFYFGLHSIPLAFVEMLLRLQHLNILVHIPVDLVREGNQNVVLQVTVLRKSKLLDNESCGRCVDQQG